MARKLIDISVPLQNDVPADARAKLLDYMGQSRAQKYPAFWSGDDKANHRLRTVAHLTLTLPEFQLD